MPKTALVVDRRYAKLLENVRREMVKGIRQMEQQKIRTYWAIGRQINGYLALRPRQVGGVGQFYKCFSDDLQVSDRTLQHCEQFYRFFPRLKIEEGLTWSHYRFLLVLSKEDERLKWIKRTIKHQWTTNQLRFKLSAAQKNKFNQEIIVNLKKPQRGKLYTYSLIPHESRGGSILWFVDCGFKNRVDAPSSKTALHNKWLYTSKKTNDGYCIKVTGGVVEELYTFKAQLQRVIDADTLLVLVDQGFGIWTEQRLRLRGIDAPELHTLGGKAAKEWVEKKLIKLPFLIVKTYKSDKYDRYLVDIFYDSQQRDPQKVAAAGTWLNGELVATGQAKLWG